MAVHDAPHAVRPRGTNVLALPDLRRTRPEDWAELVRFCIVGFSGYLINLGVYSALVQVAGAHYVGAAIVAFLVAWTSNFALNKHWTFRRHGLSTIQQGARNLMVSLIALGLNVALLAMMVEAGLHKIPSQAIAIAAVTPVSFLVNRRWSFR